MTGIEVAMIAAGVGTALSAAGSIQEGRAANVSAKFQAAQYQQEAKKQDAEAQRQAIERKRQIDLAQSRAQAIGAASGVSSASPTISNILAGLDAESQYAFDTSIVAGQESATGLRTAADVQILAGKNAKRAGLYGAIGNISQFAAMSSYGGNAKGGVK